MSTSPRFSFVGYDPRVALAKNMDNVKLILALLSGVTFVQGFDWKSFGLSFLGAVCILGVKLGADALDYYFSEVQNP